MELGFGRNSEVVTGGDKAVYKAGFSQPLASVRAIQQPVVEASI